MIISLETRKIGAYEIRLPSFMSTLPQEVIDKFYVDDYKVISCGVDPSDSCLYMITPQPTIKILRPNGNMIPMDAFPSYDGNMLGVAFQSIEGYHPIKSETALFLAKNCFDEADIFVNDIYVCGLELTNIETPLRQDDNNVR